MTIVMNTTMAIVLPGKKRKKTDIFAPSQAIQDAKEKIGPAFFDISLLECSRNAVELTKLVARWDELEKEKLKIIRDINREEDVLLRSLKAHKTNGRHGKDGKNNGHSISSTEGIETLDGKIVPPGFRFTSNGDIKASTVSLPFVKTNEEIVNIEMIGEAKNDGLGKTSITKTHNEKNENGSDDITYHEQELFEVESVIKNIYKNISRFGLNAQKFPANEKTHAYLRAHKNDYTGTENTSSPHDYQSPNDRFAFKPGTSKKLHKSEIKTPTYRSCIGCKFKLKCDAEETIQLMKAHSEDLGKRRWSYVPRGKYVQSSSSLLPKSSTMQAGDQSVANRKHDSAKSVVHFETSGLDMPKRANSLQTYKSRHFINDQTPKTTISVQSARSAQSAQDVRRSSLSAHSKRSVMTPSDYGRSISSISRVSGLSNSRIGAHLLVDHESRMQRLKIFQEEEQHSCDEKVKTFLRKLDPDTAKKDL